jgi:hypothetical protein
LALSFSLLWIGEEGFPEVAYSDYGVEYGHEELLLETRNFRFFLFSHLLLIDGLWFLVVAYSDSGIYC